MLVHENFFELDEFTFVFVIGKGERVHFSILIFTFTLHFSNQIVKFYFCHFWFEFLLNFFFFELYISPMFTLYYNFLYFFYLALFKYILE